MNNTNKRQRPQVPGGDPYGCAGVDGCHASPGVIRGAKNLRVGASRQTTQARKKDTESLLNIITYNVRTLKSDERLLELDNALADIKWDIVGLSEVRRKGEVTLERENDIFYYYGETGNLYGVGFLVKKKWKNNILEFISYSERIAILKLKVHKNKTITVIQVYSPTTSHPAEEVEDFYDLLNDACDTHRGTWNIVLGDFNAKIGKRESTDNTDILGPHGLGIRNERGKRLIQFAFGQNLSISNTFFYKKPGSRWTWIAPDPRIKNEIDFALISDQNLVNNVNVINKFKFNSDHRPVRVTLSFNKKLHRSKTFNNNKIKKLDKESLVNNQNTFNSELQNSFQLLNMECMEVQEQ